MLWAAVAASRMGRTMLRAVATLKTARIAKTAATDPMMVRRMEEALASRTEAMRAFSLSMLSMYTPVPIHMSVPGIISA